MVFVMMILVHGLKSPIEMSIVDICKCNWGRITISCESNELQIGAHCSQVYKLKENLREDIILKSIDSKTNMWIPITLKNPC